MPSLRDLTLRSTLSLWRSEYYLATCPKWIRPQACSTLEVSRDLAISWPAPRSLNPCDLFPFYYPIPPSVACFSLKLSTANPRPFIMIPIDSWSSLTTEDLLSELSKRQHSGAAMDGPKPECGSTMNMGSYNTPLHVGALFLILCLGTISTFPRLLFLLQRLAGG